MSSRFTGSFYFKRTVNRNLIGEFTNNEEPLIRTESAQSTNISVNFVGIYFSTWFDGGLQSATLTITGPDTGVGKFKLEWRGGNIDYDGEGFLVDDMLMGQYAKIR